MFYKHKTDTPHPVDDPTSDIHNPPRTLRSSNIKGSCVTELMHDLSTYVHLVLLYHAFCLVCSWWWHPHSAQGCCGCVSRLLERDLRASVRWRSLYHFILCRPELV